MSTAQQLPWSLTAHLLSLAPREYEAATQAPFLLAAAEGRLPKPTLSRWLANDRLYIHSYMRAAATLLASLDLPQAVAVPGASGPPGASTAGEPVELQLADWLIEALVGVRREERFFLDVAARYGLGVDLTVLTPPAIPVGDAGSTAVAAAAADPPPSSAASHTQRAVVPEEAKLPGLLMIEKIFAEIAPPAASSVGSSALVSASASPPPPLLLPWLEGAVTFWGTERCYLDAWSWARARQALVGVGRAAADPDDADGGALRNEFIPNWSSAEFAAFVARLGALVDAAVGDAVARLGDSAKDAILARVEGRWKSLLVAEATFWPPVE